MELVNYYVIGIVLGILYASYGHYNLSLNIYESFMMAMSWIVAYSLMMITITKLK